MQLKVKHSLEMPGNPPDTERFAIFRGVVLVNYQPSVYVNQQNGILVLIDNRVNTDALREGDPFVVWQYAYPMPGRFQIVFYPAAVVVGQQKLTFGQHRKGGEVQVVGMTVREPVVSCFSYRLHLCCRDSMRLSPTTEISAVTNPWISCEHGPIVIVRNED